MTRAFARMAWLALLFLLSVPARASEAPPDAPDVEVAKASPFLPPIDAKAFRRTRTPYWIGMGLMLGGTGAGIGFFTLTVMGCMEGCDGFPPLSATLIAFSAATAVAGQAAMVYSALWGNAYLRGHGLYAPRDLAIAAAVVPAVCVATGVALGLLSGKREDHKPEMVYAGMIVGTAGWFASMALSGAQLKLNRRVAIGKVSYQASLAPTLIRGAPGAVVALRW